jgi:hypothetical protein
MSLSFRGEAEQWAALSQTWQGKSKATTRRAQPRPICLQAQSGTLCFNDPTKTEILHLSFSGQFSPLISNNLASESSEPHVHTVQVHLSLCLSYTRFAGFGSNAQPPSLNERRLIGSVRTRQINMSASQPQARRAYQRYPAEAWDAHKPTIRELFLEQNRPYEEVAATLKTAHGFDVG